MRLFIDSWKGRLRIAVAAVAAVLAAAGCDDYGSRSYAPNPVVATLTLSLADAEAEIGQFTQATATARDQSGAVIAVPVVYSSSAPEIAGVQPSDGRILAVAPGTATITAIAGGRSATKAIVVVATPPIFINEVTPLGDAANGWVELYNPTASDVSVGGWTFTNANLFQPATLAAGMVVPAGGFLVIDEGTFPAGLGGAGTVRLFSKFGLQSDAFVWGHEPGTSFGRCPDGQSGLIPTAAATKGAANDCF